MLNFKEKICLLTVSDNIGSIHFIIKIFDMLLTWNLIPPSYLVPGIIVTGGNPTQTAGVSVEVFNPHTYHSCSLPDLPGEVRYSHSLCRDLLCGGQSSSSRRSCLKLNPLRGVFNHTSVSLVEERANNLCWDVEGEGGQTLLVGGTYSGRTTELVSSDGLSTSANFSLQYDAR